MSVNTISNNSGNTTSVEETNKENEAYTNFQNQYQELKDTLNEISGTDECINNITYINKIADKIKELLETLDGIVADGFDEKVVKEAMQALATLLNGTNTMMSLKARLTCLAMLNTAVPSLISEDNYSKILDKLNNLEKDYSVLDFKKDFYTAKVDKLLSEDTKKDIIDKIKNADNENDLDKIYNDAAINAENEVLKKEKEALVDKLKGVFEEAAEISNNKLNTAKGIAATTSASLTLKVMQANTQFKEIELENISDQKKEQEAKKNPMFKKLRDEGMWKESTVDRYQEMLSEERIKEIRNTNRK